MKILFLERSLGMGGAQRQMVALSIGLKRRGHDVTVALFYREGAFIPELEAAGVTVDVLKKTSRWDVARFTWNLRAYVKREQPDVLCTFLEVPNLFAALLKTMMPNLRVVWGIRASNMDMTLYDGLSRIAYRAGAWLSLFPNLIVANSEAGKAAAIKRGLRTKRLVVVPNGIDTDRFRFDAAGRTSVRSEWQIGDDELLIGIVARFDPMKGHEDFIGAAALVPNARFVCIGENGPYSASDVAAMAARHGLTPPRFIVPGKRDDIPSVMSALDIVCSTSRSGEGFSNSIAEAMACSRPCIATDVGDARIVLGETGRIVPVGDVSAIAKSMADLVKDRATRDRLGQAARDRILQFSVPRMVDRFEGLFLGVVNNRKLEAASRLPA